MELTFKVAGHKLVYDISPETCPEEFFKSFRPFESDCAGEALSRIRFVKDISEEGTEEVFAEIDRQPGMTGVDVLSAGEGKTLFRVVMPNGNLGARLLMDSGVRNGTAALYADGIEKYYAFTSLTVLAFSLASARFDTLMVHSSVVSHNGKGWMFLGKSGTGKSTHSRLWLENIKGCSLMNDDHPVIRIVDGVAYVFGSPWSGKTPCYKNVSAPIGGIVRLNQAPYNSISRPDVLRSYAALVPSFSGISWDKASADGRNATIERIIRTVPVWNLDCLPDADAAFVCHDAVSKGAEGCCVNCHLL